MSHSSQRSYHFALNSDAAFGLHRVGREQEPVLVLDRVLSKPDELVEYAAREVSFQGEENIALYPGVRAPAPLDYVETLARAVSPLITTIFGIEGAALVRAECSFSIVTTPPQLLSPGQRVPHIDTSYPLQFALLHYLCDPRHGGTAFYRQRATGFELITPEREADFHAAQKAELALLEEERGEYITGPTAAYEQTAVFEAQFNRMLVYRSCAIHSGMIGQDGWSSADPRKGRLTANIFLSYRA